MDFVSVKFRIMNDCVSEDFFNFSKLRISVAYAEVSIFVAIGYFKVQVTESPDDVLAVWIVFHCSVHLGVVISMFIDKHFVM